MAARVLAARDCHAGGRAGMAWSGLPTANCGPRTATRQNAATPARRVARTCYARQSANVRQLDAGTRLYCCRRHV